jgi:hypothetical protein
MPADEGSGAQDVCSPQGQSIAANRATTSSCSNDHTEDSCPHVDRDDPRCAHRLSINRIDQAFNVCFGSYRGCPVFQRIATTSEPLGHDLARSFVEIRIVARPRLRRLRPTGS